MKKCSYIKGVSVVEIIIAAAIIGISVVGIAVAIQIYLKIVHQNSREVQAVLLMDETAEALQYIRDVDFEEIQESDPNIKYSIFWNGFGYELTEDTISLPYNMVRTIKFSDVYRDTLDQIDMNNIEILDLETKKAEITIEWEYSNTQKSLTSEMLIHNIYAN